MTRWTITWGERSWTDADVRAADLASIQLLIGGSWENCEPFAGPSQLMAMITALECRTSGRDLDAVMAEVRDSPAADLVAAIKTGQVEAV